MDNNQDINAKQKATLEKLEKMREKVLDKDECKKIANKLTEYILQDKK